MSSSPTDPRLTSTVRLPRDGSRATVSAEIMVAAIVFFVMTVAFVVFLYLYARWRWGPGSAERRARERRMRRGDHVDRADRARARRLARGLDTAVLEALPMKVYKREDFPEDGGVECAVCLTELSDGEKVRMLPKCNHGFHVECIDMWFASHATCPLCRDPVGKQQGGDKQEEELEDEETTTTENTAAPDTDEQHSTEPPPNFPTNVLFWGTQDQVSIAAPPATQLEPEPAAIPSSAAGTSGSGKLDGALVIDIPPRVVEGLPSSSSSPSSIRSGWAATPTRLRSFRRLFSREKRVAATPGCSCEGGAGDIEQGCSGADAFVISTTPKTPPALRVSAPKTPTQTG